MAQKLEKISYKNFKCLDNIKLNLGKLTVLTGANSSGKSSVLQGVLGMVQSDKFPLYYSPNGKYVDMGDFKEIAFRHDNRKIIELNCQIMDDDNKSYNINSTWKNDTKTKSPLLYGCSIESDYSNIKLVKRSDSYSVSFELNRSKYWADMGKKEKEIQKAITNIIDTIGHFIEKGSSTSKRPRSKFIDVKSKLKIRRKVKSVDKFIGTVSKFGNRLDTFQIRNQFMLAQSFERNFNFISSFRLHPQRTYLQRTKSEYKVDKFGDNSIDQILEWYHKNPKMLKQLNDHLKKIGLSYSVRPRQLKSGRFELRVKTFRYGTYDSIADVGFGISQFMPIVIADMQLAKNSTLIVAQPEIHLHPNSQANFGDYLTEQINENNKRYIIETHSEYLLNRLRLNIVKGKIKEDDIAVYFLENNKNGIRSHEVAFTKKGTIENAPKSFFDTYMIDVMDIALGI